MDDRFLSYNGILSFLYLERWEHAGKNYSSLAGDGSPGSLSVL